MKHIYSLLIFILSGAFHFSSNAQITCNFNLADTLECSVLGIQATPAEVSSSAITSRVWDLDGPINPNPVTSTNYSYIANVCGLYTLTLTSTNANGQTCSITKNMRVACPPVVNVTFSPTIGCVPFTTTATLNISPPPPATIDSIFISWGCGGRIDTIVGNPGIVLHDYVNCSPGCVTPTFIVKNSFGCTTTESFSCAVEAAPCPSANFSADTTIRYCSTSPLNVVFTATDSVPNTTYCWYIDSFTTPVVPCSGSRTLNYSFPVGPGCHNIRLITERGGYRDTLDRMGYICNNPSVTAQFTTNHDTVCISPTQSATFVMTNAASGDLTWNLTGFPQQVGPSATYTITSPGSYTATATANYGPGCTSTVTRQVLVAYNRPTANFTINDTFSCTVPFTFCATAVPCTGCNYEFRITGGSPVNQQNPCFTVSAFNTYSVRLVVTNPAGCKDTLIKTVVVRRVTPRISVVNGSGCSPVCFTVTDNTDYSAIPEPIDSVCWSFPGSSFPDVCTAPGGNVSHCLTSSGCISARLRIVTSSGCVATAQVDTICVGVAPVCSVSLTPTAVCFEADPVQAIVNCNSQVTRVCVDWDDAPPAGWVCYTNLPVPPYTFRNPGPHNVRVMVFNNGCTDSTIYTSNVQVDFPIAKFTQGPITCASGNTINFVNQSQQATSSLWTFTCPSITETSTLTNPSIVFPQCETCTAHLEVTNSSTGCTHDVSSTITTNCNTVAIAPTDTSVCAGGSIRFVNRTIGSTRTRWDFDVVNGQFIPHRNGTPQTWTYPRPGSFVVGMENRSQANCLDTVYARVRVCDTVMDFSFNNTCHPAPICFNGTANDSFCALTSIVWNFGDGQLDSTGTLTPCHSYATAGNYNVTLTIRRDTACFQSVTKQVISVGNLVYNYVIDSTVCPGVQHCITNNSTGTNLTYSWEIPDGLGGYDIDTTPNPPCFTINTQGDFPAYFSVSSDSICFNRDTIVIQSCMPVAAGTVSVDTIECPNPPQLVSMRGDSTCADTWSWFDGVHTSNLQSPTWVYSEPGEYVVCVTVTSDSGYCVSTACVDTVLVKGPQGFFTTDPQNGVCYCSDSLNINVNSVYATNLLLLYGCQVGFEDDTIVPVGTPVDTSFRNYKIPYCMPTGLDTCRPQLLLTDANGCQVFFELDIEVISVDTPVIGYAFQNFGVCNTGNVCFQDTTKYKFSPPYSYTLRREWDFGDSTPIDTAENPCHFYANPGAYYPTLRIWSNVGCFDSLTTQLVVVSDYPDAMFYADDTIICEDNTVCFFDTSDIFQYSAAAYWTYDFGDNSGIVTNYSGDTCHFYPNGGDYRVTMCVYDTLGCGDCDSSVVIHVITNPVADAGGDRILCYDVPTTICGTGALTCVWTPSALFSNNQICCPSATLLSDQQVVLEVGDQYGCSDRDTITLRVGQVFADFTVRNTYCLSNNVCPIDISTSTNGVVNSWTWDFGDLQNPGTQTGQSACHQYVDTGFKTILLTAIDTNGCIDTISKTIYVYANPVAAFSLNDSVLCSNQQLCVADFSTSGSAISTWSWNYGCLGCVASGQTPPCYTYQPQYQSNYNVSLIIEDANNCKDTAVIPVTFYVAPEADFSWNPSCEDECMPLTSTSVQGTGAINFCAWTLGVTPPVTDNNCNTCYQFPPGSHQVSYLVTDINGCTDSITKTVFTDSLTQLSVNPGDTTVCLGTPIDYVVGGIYDTLIWTPDVWISDPTSPQVTVTPLGNVGYIITAVNGVCDPASDTVTIRVIQPLPIDIIAVPDRIVLGMSSQITTTIPGPITSITWVPDSTLSCNNCLNPVATPTQTTTYTAYVTTDQSGITCNIEGSITIYVLNSCNESIIYLPNTFTPNADGMNDVFMIRGIAASKINYFRVFDRWGKLVFDKSNGLPNVPDWGWDGNDRSGNKLEPGVFVFSYEIVCMNGDVVNGKGNVTLVR